MSDIVLVSLIAAVPGTLTALGILINISISISHDRSSNRRKDELDKKIAAQGNVMENLEKNTNSMKDALVKVTGEKAFAEGVKQGGIEEQARAPKS